MGETIMKTNLELIPPSALTNPYPFMAYTTYGDDKKMVVLFYGAGKGVVLHNEQGTAGLPVGYHSTAFTKIDGPCVGERVWTIMRPGSTVSIEQGDITEALELQAMGD